MVMLSGAMPRAGLDHAGGARRDERAAAAFQAAMTAQLLKPALPKLLSAFSGGSGGASETMEFASQVLSDALAQQIAKRDPFNLSPVVMAEIEARKARAGGDAAGPRAVSP